MANYRDSITTRYGTTLTATNDNTSAFAATSTNLSLSGDTLTVSGDVSWNGQIGGSAQDVVMFNKTIILQDDSRLHGNGTNGAHWWLVNCNILVEDSGSFGVNDTRLAAGPASNLGNGSRNDTITGTDGSDCTFNMYNCIITFMSTDSNPNGDIVLGTAEDVEFHYLYPSGNKADAFPQNGSDWDRIVFNASTANSSKQNGYQLFSAPDKFDGIQLINFWGYTGSDSASGGIEVTYDGFSAINNFNPTDNSDADAAYTIYEVAGFGEVGPYGTCTNMVSPKSDLTPDGAVRWRRLAGSNARPDEHLDHSIILRQDIRRNFFDDDESGRKDVRMYFNTNVELTQKAGVTSPPDDTADLPSKSYLFYTTDSDGDLTGTYNFNDGETVASQKWGVDAAPIRLPLQWMRTGDETNNDNEYSNSIYSFESDITEFSLWGTRYATYTRNEDQVLSTPVNGYYIEPNSENHVDPNESMMDEYDETIGTLTGKFTASTGAISWNDIGAIYKYAAWSRIIPLDNWSSTKVSGTKVNLSGSTVNKLQVGNNGDAVSLEGTDTLHIDAPEAAGLITIDYDEADHIEAIDFHTIDATDTRTLRINGGDVNVSFLSDLHSFTSVPSDFASNYSVKNAKLTGSDTTATCTINLEGDNGIWIFNDLDRASNITLTAANAAHSYIAIATGDTNINNISTSASNITIQSIVEITVDGGAGHTAASGNVGAAVFRFGNSVADARDNGTLADVAAGNITTSGSTYTFRFEVPKGDSVYAAIAIDGFEIEAFEGVGNTTRDLTAIDSTRLSFDTASFGVWGDTTITAADVTVGNDADGTDIAADDDPIVVTLGVSGNSVSPTQATDVKVRTLLRKYVQENDGWLNAVLLGYVPSGFIRWDLNNIAVPMAMNDRLELNRVADTANSWRVDTVCLDTDGNDLFDTQTKSGQTGEQILFSPNASGASLSQVSNVVNAARDTIMGETGSDDGRNVKEAYNQAKGAKNAAYAAG